MGWSCAICTFENRSDSSTLCEICETTRGESSPTIVKRPNYDSSTGMSSIQPSLGHEKKSSSPRKKASGTIQATLFGSVAKPLEKKKASNKSNADKLKGKRAGKSNTALSKEESAAREDCSTSNRNNLGTTLLIANAPANALDSTTTTTIRQRSLDFTRKVATTKVESTINMSFSELKQRAKGIMKTVFGIEKLRFLQPLAITCALKRESQIIVMATGGGKSLCYQLPALVLGGTTIVISPLIALMQDQVQSLVEKGVQAAVISSNNGEKHNLDVMERLVGRGLRATKKPVGPLVPITLVYVTPEQVQTNRFRDILRELNKKKQLTMFAVDEAHCLSSWGHDFRKSYMQLGYLRETYPKVPLMACTATATPAVLRDIKQVLLLEQSPCHVGSFDRPNIFYKVKYKDSLDAIRPGGAIGDLVDFIKNTHKKAEKKSLLCTGIIYVHTRQDTIDIANTIRLQCGIVAVAYNAGLKVDERNKAQESWTSGVAKIAVATVAFGMGIDLGHVRYVVHWTLSKNIESFYQESGRAGRDGLPSFSVVYYSKDDASKFQFLLSNKRSKDGKPEPSVRDLAALEEMIEYCTVPACRRCRLLKHFGEKVENPAQVCTKTCDFCQDPDRVRRSIEAASGAKEFSFHARLAEPKNTSSKRKWNASDADDDFTAPFSVGGLGITQAGASSSGDGVDFGGADSKPTANFVKASAILSKYEAIECRGKNGFVRFKQKLSSGRGEDAEKRDDHIRIPKHLIPASTLVVPTKVEKTEKTSADCASEIDRLKKELDELKSTTELRKKAMEQSKSSGSSNLAGSQLPAPPPPTFTAKKRR